MDEVTGSGLDLLREEMLRRGLVKTQVESKTAAVVLDILANSGDLYQRVQQAEIETSKELKELERKRTWYQHVNQNEQRKLEDMRREEKELEKKADELREYIEEFNRRLEECETAEGRDVMRTAQMYANTVQLKTVYDNTAYIIGLGAILSRGGINALEELKKINWKMFPRTEYI